MSVGLSSAPGGTAFFASIRAVSGGGGRLPCGVCSGPFSICWGTKKGSWAIISGRNLCSGNRGGAGVGVPCPAFGTAEGWGGAPRSLFFGTSATRTGWGLTSATRSCCVRGGVCPKGIQIAANASTAAAPTAVIQPTGAERRGAGAGSRRSRRRGHRSAGTDVFAAAFGIRAAE